MKTLTPTQTKALQLAADGLKVSEIAIEMRVSVRTVEAHLANARERLEAKNTTEAAAKAVRSGVIWGLILTLLVDTTAIDINAFAPCSPSILTRIPGIVSPVVSTYFLFYFARVL